MLKLLLFITGFILLANFGHAQSDTLNQKDDQGKKQGYWIITGKMRPDKGFCDTCKIEEGNYLDNRKNGLWIKYFNDGITERFRATYRNGRPAGPYVKYWLDGRLKEEGDFSKGRQKGVLKKYSEYGTLTLSKNYNDAGREDGWAHYYFVNCDSADKTVREQLVYFKRDGVTQNKSYRYYYSGCIQQINYYENDGSFEEVLMYQNDCDLDDSLKLGTKGKVDKDDPCNRKEKFDAGKRNPPPRFDPNGYNEIHDKNNQIWMKGEFRGGKLFNGRLYKYDSDGLFKKVEIWEGGLYSKDGTLDKMDEIRVPYSRDKDQDKGNFDPIKREGFNKVYNAQDVIWMEGEFRDGKLWEGKKYFYDDDGILLKIELWRKGEFYSPNGE